jgi:carboxyl-terminal processing protease
MLHLTTATFWRPSGRNLNKSSTTGKLDEDWGVRPDKGFDMPLSRKEQADLFNNMAIREKIYPPGRRPKDLDQFRDRQLERALDYLNDLLVQPFDPRKNKIVDT